ncbi:MAG: hypothetical protein EBX65_05540 [Betaproteobacteria bacterium]|nr:hypothetical protein [Betaproteobacteria bacterium]
MLLTHEQMLAAIESPSLREFIANRMEVDEHELEAMLDEENESLMSTIVEVLVEDGPLVDELVGPLPQDEDDEPFSVSIFGVDGIFVALTSTEELHGGFNTAQEAFDFIDREYERELANPYEDD